MVKLTLRTGGADFPVEMESRDGQFYLRIAGEPVETDVGWGADGLLSILLDGRSYEARVAIEDGEIVVEIDGERFRFERAERSGAGPKARRHTSGRTEVKAPMPGKIVKLLVAPGEDVESGQGLLLFEAMKMQNEIRSPQAGRVAAVAVREGQTVESKDLLLTVQEEPSAHLPLGVGPQRPTHG